MLVYWTWTNSVRPELHLWERSIPPICNSQVFVAVVFPGKLTHTHTHSHWGRQPKTYQMLLKLNAINPPAMACTPLWNDEFPKIKSGKLRQSLETFPNPPLLSILNYEMESKLLIRFLRTELKQEKLWSVILQPSRNVEFNLKSKKWPIELQNKCS